VCVAEQKSLLQIMPMQNQLAEKFKERAPNLNDIGIQILQVGQFRLNLDESDEQTLKEAQAEIGAAKRAARKAQIGVSQAEAEARQRQFELDQEYSQDSRYVQNLAGGSYGQYAAGKAMIGAGEGMAQGGGGEGGGGPMMAGAGLGVGLGMAQVMGQGFAGGQQAQPQQQPRPPTPTGPVACPECTQTVPGGKFCANCGATLAPRPKFCPSCGAQGSPVGKFCAECGTAFPVAT